MYDPYSRGSFEVALTPNFSIEYRKLMKILLNLDAVNNVSEHIESVILAGQDGAALAAAKLAAQLSAAAAAASAAESDEDRIAAEAAMAAAQQAAADAIAAALSIGPISEVLDPLLNPTFLAISDLIIKDTVDILWTSGFSEKGVGPACYVYDASITEEDVAADPLWVRMSDNGRGYRLAERRVDPKMFGALGQADGWFTEDVFSNQDICDKLATSIKGDLAHDDTEAVQACSHYWFDNPRTHMDLSTGDWAISSTVYIVPAGAKGRLQGRPDTQTWTGGHFYLLPDFQEDRAAIVIAGYAQKGDGFLWVDGQYREYADRRAKVGIELREVNNADLPRMHVEGVKRVGVRFAPSLIEDNNVTIYEGTPREIAFTYSNNIAASLGPVSGRSIGIDFSLHAFDFPTYTALYGGVDSNTGAWIPGASGFYNSGAQRSRVSGIDTTDLEVGDLVMNRYEVHHDQFGQFTSSAADSCFRVTTGDATEWFQVGDKMGPTSGPNGGQVFTVTGFAEGNKRINVYPAPATTTISYPPVGSSIADFYQLVTEPTWHVVTAIRSASIAEIFPWLPAQTGAVGKWWPCYGAALYVGGGDTANVTIEKVAGYGTGVTYRCDALFAPKLLTALCENTMVGIQQGYRTDNNVNGMVVGQHHMEGTYADFVQVTSSPASSISFDGDSYSTVLGSSIDPFVKWHALQVRASTTERVTPHRPFTNVSIKAGGRSFEWRNGPSFYEATNIPHLKSGGRHLSNMVGYDHKLMLGNDITVEVDFSERFASLFADRCTATINWDTETGVAPTGTATFNLSPDLIAAGWAWAGGHTLTAPAGPVDFTFKFKPTLKTVSVSKVVRTPV